MLERKFVSGQAARRGRGGCQDHDYHRHPSYNGGGGLVGRDSGVLAESEGRQQSGRH